MGTFNKFARGEGDFGVPEVVDVTETAIGNDIVVVI